MRTLGILSTKGGVGKSTLVRHAAVLLPGSAILDLDAQHTSRNWMQRRVDAGLPCPRIVDGRADQAEELKAACEEAGVEWLILDTPPDHDDTRALMAAARAADRIIIPLTPSPDDLEAVAPAVNVARRVGKPYAFCLTMVPARMAMTKELREQLRKTAELTSEIGHRVAFRYAPIEGLSVEEYEPGGKAAAEIRAWVGWIQRWFSDAKVGDTLERQETRIAVNQ